MTVIHLRWYRFGCDHCDAVTRPVCGATLAEATAQFTELTVPWEITVTHQESARSGGIIMAARDEVDTVLCPKCQPPTGEVEP